MLAKFDVGNFVSLEAEDNDDDDGGKHPASAWLLETLLSSDSFEEEFDDNSSDEEQFVNSSLIKLVDIAESDLLLSNWQLVVVVVILGRSLKI